MLVRGAWAAALVLASVSLPGAALASGKLQAPPPGGWEQALKEASGPGWVTGAGTLNQRPDPGVSELLAEAEMAELRGGVGGLDFSVFFSGGVGPNTTEGQLIVGSDGVPIPAPSFSVENGQANIQTHIGDFQGASGIFQIAQVPGDFNIVNQNMFIQINLIDRADAAQLFGF